MIDDLTWDVIMMVVAISALAAGSITEIVKKAIQQGYIERLGKKPPWRGTVLRVCSVLSGAFFGWLMLDSSPKLGLILGVGAGSLTTEAISTAQRLLKRRNGAKTRRGKRVPHNTDFASGQDTEFRPAITDKDIQDAE